MGPSGGDETFGFQRGVPALVVFETAFANGRSVLGVLSVGPNRRGGAPNDPRTRPPSEGFPGNSVDNRGC